MTDIIELLEKRAAQIGRDRSAEHANIIFADKLLAELLGAIAEIRRLRTGALKPIAISVKKTCAVTGLGSTKIWALIKDGRLEAVHVDARTLVRYSSIERLLAAGQLQPAASRHGFIIGSRNRVDNRTRKGD